MRDSRVDSPFHSGERAVQSRAGVRERVEQVGLRIIRDYMPDEHRELFEKLPCVLLGVQDREARIWATVLTGAPGFIRTPDARTLAIAARPERHDPAFDGVALGRRVGLLGIEFHTRRRNRVNGCVAAEHGQGFSVRVDQSFGNCPKYIHPRAGLEPMHSAAVLSPEQGREAAVLSAEALALIADADTFFIATASEHAQAASIAGGTSDGSHRPPPPAGTRAEGVDVSHRGGPPGFVRLERELDRTRLVWPDYRGNSLFNTLGNLAVNPRAGLLFIDFEGGRALALTGTAQVDWDVADVRTTPAAERTVSFDVAEGVWLGRRK